MLSVICVSNDPKKVKEMLVKSCESQHFKHELIILENQANQYRSAAQALNAGARQASGDILMFVHQDVEFSDPKFFGTLVDTLNSFKDQVIIGVAGVKDGTGVITNITQSSDHRDAGDKKPVQPEEVQTLDEVLILLKRETFKSLTFDEKTCDDWHLYGVDLCLNAGAQGIKSYVVPVVMHHASSGRLSYGYVRSFARLLRKYRRTYPFIYTTCAVSKTSFPRSVQYILGLWWDHVIKPKLNHR